MKLKHLFFPCVAITTLVAFFMFSDYSLKDIVILCAVLLTVLFSYSSMKYIEGVENNEREE